MRNNKKLIAVMVVFVFAALIFCIRVTRNDSEQTLTVTDCYGITYLAVIDQNQNVYAGVTDMDGKLYGARIDENGEVVLDGAVYPIEDYTGTLPYNDTTVVNINDSNDNAYDYGADVSRVDTATTAPQADATDGTTVGSDEPTTQKGSQSKTFLTDKYRELFESGTYVMVFKTDDPEIPDAVTSAFKNGNVCVDTQVEGLACQVIYRADEEAGWIVIPSLRTYCELPLDMALEMASVNFVSEEDYNYKNVEVYEVVIGSKTCTCEDFTYEDGSRKAYYFDESGSMVRMDLISADGVPDIYSIIKISSTVDDSFFEKPRGYLKLDLSWLSLEDMEATE